MEESNGAKRGFYCSHADPEKQAMPDDPIELVRIHPFGRDSLTMAEGRHGPFGQNDGSQMRQGTFRGKESNPERRRIPEFNQLAPWHGLG